MSAVAPPPAVQTVFGLDAFVDRGPWSVISTLGANQSSSIPITPASAYGNSGMEVLVVDYMAQEMSPVAAPKIRLVHANFNTTATVTADAAVGEAAPYSEPSLSACVIDLVNAASRKVAWGGKKTLDFDAWGIFTSDDIPVAVPANTWYVPETAAAVPSADSMIPAAAARGASAGGVSLFTKSGSTPSDKTNGQKGTATPPAPTGTGISHVLVLGYTGANPTKTVATWGDSNQVPLGAEPLGGWVDRVRLGNVNLSVTEANITSVAYGGANFSKQGESLRGFAKDNQHEVRKKLTAKHTNVICTLGANDCLASVSLANMQAAAIKLALECTGMRVKLFMCTVPPIVTVSNGGRYAADLSTVQTPTFNVTRVAYNSWLLDPSNAGFVAQALAAGASIYYLTVYDAATVLEVNAAGVKTVNGGYVRTPGPSDTPLYTGTVTTGGSTSQLTDTAASAVVNTYRGCVFVGKTGVNANVAASVSGNSAAKVITFNKGLTGAFSVGDQYELWGNAAQPTLVDQVHIADLGHIAIAQDFVATQTSKLI